MRQLCQRAGVANLELFRMRGWRAHQVRDVAGDLIATDRQRCGVAQRAACVDRDVRGAGTQIDQADAQLLFIRRQHGARRCHRGRRELAKQMDCRFEPMVGRQPELDAF